MVLQAVCIAPITHFFLRTNPTPCPTRTPTINGSLQSSSSSPWHSFSPPVGNSADAGPNKPSPNRLSVKAGPCTGVRTAPLVVQGRSRRRPRLRCTMVSTRRTFMIPPRALLQFVKFPSLLPSSLIDPLTLCLVAFHPVAAVSSSVAWWPPGYIRPERNGVGWLGGM